jgi:hypothetical protein
MRLSLVQLADFAVLFRAGLVARRGRGMTLYRRFGNSWQRRVRHTLAAEVWLNAKRVPRQVREVAESYPPWHDIQIEFDNVTRRAFKREEWRVR